MAGLPFGLHQWAIGKVVEYAITNWSDITERLSRGTTVDVQMVRKELRAAATAERDRAASLGTAVHEVAALGRTPEQVPAEVAPRLRQYLAWKAASRAEIVASEFQVFSTTYGYAGSCDALVRFADGPLWIVDYKTGKGIYAEHALQLTAYGEAALIAPQGSPIAYPMPSIERYVVLHVTDAGVRVIDVEVDDDDRAALRACLPLSRWHTARKGQRL
jgi:hypothetical protein